MNRFFSLLLMLTLLSGCTHSTQIPDTSPTPDASPTTLENKVPLSDSRASNTANERSADTLSSTQPTGAQVAMKLNIRYTEDLDDCGVSGSFYPLYNCSGVIIRSTEDGAHDPWNPSPAAIELGAVSFSWLKLSYLLIEREGALVTNLYHNSGFIFLPPDQANAQGKQLDYLCFYPYDAGTLGDDSGTIGGHRGSHGCGLKTRAASATDLSTCGSLGVAGSVTLWASYTRTLPNRNYQCSFSTKDSNQFHVGFTARRVDMPNMVSEWNELLIAVWPENIPARLPLEAFFYKNIAGLAEAKHYQTKYKNSTGGWLPIIKLDFTRVRSSPFSYSAGDQAIQQ